VVRNAALELGNAYDLGISSGDDLLADVGAA